MAFAPARGSAGAVASSALMLSLAAIPGGDREARARAEALQPEPVRGTRSHNLRPTTRAASSPRKRAGESKRLSAPKLPRPRKRAKHAEAPARRRQEATGDGTVTRRNAAPEATATGERATQEQPGEQTRRRRAKLSTAGAETARKHSVEAESPAESGRTSTESPPSRRHVRPRRKANRSKPRVRAPLRRKVARPPAEAPPPGATSARQCRRLAASRRSRRLLPAGAQPAWRQVAHCDRRRSRTGQAPGKTRDGDVAQAPPSPGCGSRTGGRVATLGAPGRRAPPGQEPLEARSARQAQRHGARSSPLATTITRIVGRRAHARPRSLIGALLALALALGARTRLMRAARVDWSANAASCSRTWACCRPRCCR